MTGWLCPWCFAADEPFVSHACDSMLAMCELFGVSPELAKKAAREAAPVPTQRGKQ